MTYPGGKNGAGTYQAIINQMPPHRVYIEPFAGSGAVLRRKRPAAETIAIDMDADVRRYFDGRPSTTFIHGDALPWLQHRRWRGGELVYADPPYLWGARSQARAIYKHEMGDIDHLVLLRILRDVPALVMISGYASDLYDRELAGWRRVEFQAMTRGGLRTEILWCNFPEPVALHDYRYLGADYRERERIAKRVRRLLAKIDAMPDLERRAILSAVSDRFPPAVAMTDSDTIGIGGAILPPEAAVSPIGHQAAPPETAARSRTAVFGGGSSPPERAMAAGE